MRLFLPVIVPFLLVASFFVSATAPAESAPLAAREDGEQSRWLVDLGTSKIRIFPAVPTAWKDASFDRLRAEGGFAVSAMRRGGKTTQVRIKSLAGQVCRIKPGFDGPPKLLVNGRPAAVKPIEKGIYELPLIKGDEALLVSGEDSPRIVDSVGKSELDGPATGPAKTP